MTAIDKNHQIPARSLRTNRKFNINAKKHAKGGN